MARLRIDVNELGTEGLRIELGTADRSKVIDLAPGGGVHGRYAQDDDSIGLHSVTAESLALQELSWPLSRGRLRVSATLRDVELDIVIALGDRGDRKAMVGTIRAKTVEAHIQLQLDELELDLGGLALEDFELVSSEDAPLHLRASGSVLANLRVSRGPLSATAHGLEFLEPLGMEQGRVYAGEATIKRASLGLSSLPRRAPASEQSKADEGPRTRPPLPFDALDGHLDAKITSEVTVPILGRRVANHSLDLDLVAGAIDYRELERGLSLLEGLVVDFKLKKDALHLRKDVPLVPFDTKTLLYWPLDAEGIERAKRKQIRLATLLRPQLPEPDEKAKAKQRKREQEGKKKEPRLKLHRIDVKGIDVELSAGPSFALAVAGGRVRAASPEAPAVDALHLQGSLAHVPDEAPEGSLVVAARKLRLALESLSVAGRCLGLQALEVGTLSRAELCLAGIVPQSLDLEVEAVHLRGLDLRRRRATS